MSDMMKKLKEYSEELINKYLICVEKGAIAKQLLFTKNSFESKENLWRQAFIAVRESLFSDFVLSVANLIMDKHKKVASYANIYEMINRPDVRVLLEKQHNRLDPEIGIVAPNLDPQFAEETRQQMERDRLKDQIKLFNQLYPKVIKEGKKLLS